MSFDVIRFLRDHHIPFITEGTKHCRQGWVNVPCPFCSGNPGYHLGFELGGQQRIACWRCRGKSLWQAVKGLAGCGDAGVGRILDTYQGKSTPRQFQAPERQSKINTRQQKETKLPAGTGPMTAAQRAYLESRNFDPDLLAQVFNLQGTGPITDPSGYAHRIILPISFDKRIVSYQGRDTTGFCEAGVKYKACRMEDETIHHKHILYGMDLFRGESAAVVEGAADTWRMGPGAIATFGTGFTKEQLNLLKRRYTKLFLMFDPEPLAQQVAEELAWGFAGLGREAIMVELDPGKDPGDLPQAEADAIMRELRLRGWS